MIIPSTGPEGASFAYTREQVERIERIVQPFIDRGEVQSLFATIGGFQRPAQSNVATSSCASPRGMSGSASSSRSPRR